jgi:hypothetical protein
MAPFLGATHLLQQTHSNPAFGAGLFWRRALSFASNVRQVHRKAFFALCTKTASAAATKAIDDRP